MADMEAMAREARAAAAKVAELRTDVKDACLRTLADAIDQNVARIKEANAADVAAAKSAGLGEAKLRRLMLSDKAVTQMADGLRQVASLPDPVGQITREYTVPSGLVVRKVRCPIGVVMMIYESRPNVTVDAFALCFKAGNACILKGGREAAQSNAALAEMARGVLAAHGAPGSAVSLLTTSDREEIKRLLGMEQYIDLVIPRGGTELIRFVHEHARIPMVQHFHGVCHIYVDAAADLERAVEVCVTAKTSAPATCNAAEAVLVHRDVAARFLPLLAARLDAEGVTVRADEAARALMPTAEAAGDEDWGREYLDLVMAVRVVDGLGVAIAHIRRYGSNHTDAILTEDASVAERFLNAVQSSCALVNASTRFNDGYQLGFGAEIGISTSKIHAYGPMGLEELTSQRYVVRGDYQTR